MTELRITNLNFSYNRKKTVFKDFNLTFGDGITLLLGANGSGKSTMFKLICGALIPKSGKIEAFCDGQGISAPKTEIAYIPQNFDVFPSLSVKDVLTYICGQRGKGLKKEEIKRQVDEAVEIADIGEYVNKKMRTLSGGTKQRVGIAQSVLGNPKIIIADEPTAGLDPEQRERYNRIVLKTAKNRSFIISTHLFDDTRYYEKLVLISDGQLKFQGEKDEMTNTVAGKVYLFTCPAEKFDEDNLPEGALLLSSVLSEGKVEARLFSEKAPSSDYGEVKETEATLIDAWQKFCYASK